MIVHHDVSLWTSFIINVVNIGQPYDERSHHIIFPARDNITTLCVGPNSGEVFLCGSHYIMNLISNRAVTPMSTSAFM